ncbi:MAG: hypothetical protein ACRD3D_05075 [Terriglobia bacterium]
MAARYKITLAVAVLVFVALAAFELGRRTQRAPSFAPAASAARTGPCVDFHDAASHVGEKGCVTGYVLRAFTSQGGNTFFDFCPDYRNCPFTSVIFASDHAKFGNLETLQGRKVELRGFISAYHNQAEIIVHDPSQIQVNP